ncbi:MAG TPA: hypothetical protein PLJ21_13065 [Pseudobdellovibrionaceae bacterium]|nr:hypothetical protein [Pseudobdellovibrionaceae bacterium]
MTWDFGNVTNQAEIIIAKLKEYPFHRAINHDGVTECEGDWSYEIHYCEEDPGVPYAPWMELHITGPFCIFPTIRNNNIELSYFYRYWYIAELTMAEWYEQFRREQFEVCRILGITEVCYLADQSHITGGICQGSVWMNWPYERIKERLFEIGPPTPREQAVSYTSYESNGEKEQWFMDDFADIKAAGVDWFWSPYVHRHD